jgi:hypothetical protein
MPGPKDSRAALTWIQEAVQAGRYYPATHFYDRLYERKLEIQDVFRAIQGATSCFVHDRKPEHGGTCWRVFGRGLQEGKMLAVGVEAFLNKKKHRCILCTVFDPNESREL